MINNQFRVMVQGELLGEKAQRCPLCEFNKVCKRDLIISIIKKGVSYE